MKRLLLLTLAAIPLFAFSANFVYCDYDENWDDDYWCNEYWEPGPYWCDGYWVYYPYGHYCVYYVWYHPWWWDWYWWHCWWCHRFDWHFFGAGYYVVWFENGCWWWRPRYGRWVRYKLPYSYEVVRYKANQYGVDLPDKPPREINVPYNEQEIMKLTKEKDPKLYSRLEKEYQSGNLMKMQKEYETKVKKEIAVNNQKYQIKSDAPKNPSPVDKGHARQDIEEQKNITQDKNRPGITKKDRAEVRNSKTSDNDYDKNKPEFKKKSSDNNKEIPKTKRPAQNQKMNEDNNKPSRTKSSYSPKTRR